MILTKPNSLTRKNKKIILRQIRQKSFFFHFKVLWEVSETILLRLNGTITAFDIGAYKIYQFAFNKTFVFIILLYSIKE